MSDSEVAVTFSGDDASALAAMKRVEAEGAKVGSSIDAAGKQTRAAAAELARFADATRRFSATPLERFVEKTDKLKRSLDAGLLTQEEYNRALADAQAHFDKSSRAAANASMETKRFADAGKGVTPVALQRYNAELARLTEAHSRGKISNDQFSQGVSKARAELELVERAANRNVTTTHKNVSIVNSLWGKVTGLAGAYFSLNSVLAAVNKTLVDNIARNKEASEATTRLAPAQSEAAKNLTGLSAEEKKEVLEKGAREIQAETGFPSRGPIGAAMGAGFSASGNIEATKSAVTAAAKMTLQTPEKLPEVAAGLLDVAGATGVTDAEKNMGFLLQAGAQNRITDPVKVATTIAPVIKAAIASAPQQDPQEAAKEAGAIFGVTAREAVDAKGESSSTADITLLSKMKTFFDKRPEVDPGTILGRFKKLQDDPAMRKEFLGDEGFGEQKFRAAFEAMLTAGTKQAAAIADGAKQLSFDRREFTKAVQESTNLTPAMRQGGMKVRQEGSSERFKTREVASEAGTANEIAEGVVKDIRSEGMFEGTFEQFKDWWAGKSIAGQGAAAEPSLQYGRLKQKRDDMLAEAMLGFKGTEAAVKLEEGRRRTGMTDEQFEKTREFAGVSKEHAERARKFVELRDKPVLSDREVASATKTPELPPPEQRPDEGLRDLYALATGPDPFTGRDMLPGGQASPATGPTYGPAAPSATPKPAAAPGVDRAKLMERRNVLLRESFGLGDKSAEGAIDLVDRIKKDPELKKRLEQGGMRKLLKDSNISEEQFRRAEKYVGVRDKPTLGEADVKQLPGGLEIQDNLRKVLPLLEKAAAVPAQPAAPAAATAPPVTSERKVVAQNVKQPTSSAPPPVVVQNVPTEQQAAMATTPIVAQHPEVAAPTFVLPGGSRGGHGSTPMHDVMNEMGRESHAPSTPAPAVDDDEIQGTGFDSRTGEFEIRKERPGSTSNKVSRTSPGIMQRIDAVYRASVPATAIANRNAPRINEAVGDGQLATATDQSGGTSQASMRPPSIDVRFDSRSMDRAATRMNVAADALIAAANRLAASTPNPVAPSFSGRARAEQAQAAG